MDTKSGTVPVVLLFIGNTGNLLDCLSFLQRNWSLQSFPQLYLKFVYKTVDPFKSLIPTGFDKSTHPVFVEIPAVISSFSQPDNDRSGFSLSRLD